MNGVVAITTPSHSPFAKQMGSGISHSFSPLTQPKHYCGLDNISLGKYLYLIYYITRTNLIAKSNTVFKQLAKTCIRVKRKPFTI